MTLGLHLLQSHMLLPNCKTGMANNLAESVTIGNSKIRAILGQRVKEKEKKKQLLRA